MKDRLRRDEHGKEAGPYNAQRTSTRGLIDPACCKIYRVRGVMKHLIP